MDKIYIFEGYDSGDKVKKEDILPVLMPEENFGKDESKVLNLKIPNFVGMVQNQNEDGGFYFSLPKYAIPRYTKSDDESYKKNETPIYKKFQENNDEDCQKREKKIEEQILDLLYRYWEELSVKDPLAVLCEQYYGYYKKANELLRNYNQYGPYLSNKKKLNYRKGRDNWNITIKRTQPDYINGVPIYRRMIKEKLLTETTNISRIESGIINYCLRQRYIKRNELKYNILDSYELDVKMCGSREWEETRRLINNELKYVYDDRKADRLRILNGFFDEKKVMSSSLNNTRIVKCLYFQKELDYVYFKVQDFYGNTINARYYLKKNEKINDVKYGIGKFYKVEIEKKYFKYKIYYNIRKIDEYKIKEEEFEKQKKINVLAVADFDNVFELVIGDYFGSGIKFGEKTYAQKEDGELLNIPHVTFKSELFEEKVMDMNADQYRPGIYSVCETNSAGMPYCRYVSNKERTNVKFCNYIDVAYDYENDGEKCCVIIDAKNYGLEDVYTVDDEKQTGKIFGTKHILAQRLPENESIFKQYVYEEIMSMIYLNHSLENVKMYNVFILPAIPDYDDDGIVEQTELFKVCGHHTDIMRRKSIFLVCVNMNLLITEVLNTEKNNVSKGVLKTRREDFKKILNDYANIHKEDEIYPLFLET